MNRLKISPLFSLILPIFTLILLSCQHHNENRQKQTPAALWEAGKIITPFKNLKQKKMALPSGKILTLYMAQTPQEQTQGLSGTKESELGDYEGMYFVGNQMQQRSFWMPNTYYDLHIIFLDSENNILEVIKNVPAHPGMKEPPAIARTPSIFAQHVLEVKSSSPLAEEFKKGMALKFLD